MKTQPGTCGEMKSLCACVHDTDHAGPHECNCGGSWNDDGRVVTFPYFLDFWGREFLNVFGADPQP